MLNYYYYRMSIIFGVLFATAWMQLSRADTFDEKIHNLETSLEHAKAKFIVPASGINHFNAWESWKDVPRHFKVNCVVDYECQMYASQINYSSEDINTLGRLACEALDTHTKENAEKMKGCFEENDTFKEGIDRIVKAGKYLHLLAFFTEKFEDENLETEIGEMVLNNQNIDEDEAEDLIMADHMAHYLTNIDDTVP